jgi:NAD(P)-dependent dehydrogenase (short-subunit alcohol dehydrogenase family)
MPDKGYAGRDVLVFGAAGALGAGVATAFAKTGATVTGVDRAEPPADRQLAGVSYQAVDVLDDDALAALFDEGPAPWAVINTVGGFAPKRSLAELDPAELRGQIELNLVSAALITRQALRAMQPVGQAGSCTPPAGPRWFMPGPGSPTR